MLELAAENRSKRRTIADALEVVRLKLGVGENAPAEITLASFALPWGEVTASVILFFSHLGCFISLPASSRFRARTDTSSRPQQFETALLEGAKVYFDGTVLLKGGRRLCALEVVPTGLHRPSALDRRILEHVIALTHSYHCYRSIREGLPEDLQGRIPDLFVLDYLHVPEIEAPALKVIRGYIEVHEPQLRLSNQKIADALARWGVRVPRKRRRKMSTRATAHATI